MVLVRHRTSLVRLRTSIKNRVHALLTSEGVQTPEVSDPFGRKGLEFLEEVELRCDNPGRPLWIITWKCCES